MVAIWLWTAANAEFVLMYLRPVLEGESLDGELTLGRVCIFIF